MPSIHEHYIRHVNDSIEWHQKHNDVKQISRKTVETRFLDGINSGKFPIEFKLSWNHIVLYTTEFDSLWKFAALTHKLPDSCLERLEADVTLGEFETAYVRPPDDNDDGDGDDAPASPAAATTNRRAPPPLKRKRDVAAPKPASRAAVAPRKTPTPEPEEDANPYAKPKAKSYRRPRGTPGPRGRNLPRRGSITTPRGAQQKKKKVAFGAAQPSFPGLTSPKTQSTLTTKNVCEVTYEDSNGNDDSDGEEYDAYRDQRNIDLAESLGERTWGMSPDPIPEEEEDVEMGEAEKTDGQVRQKTQEELDEELFGNTSTPEPEPEDDSGVAGMETQLGTPDSGVGLRGGGSGSGGGEEEPEAEDEDTMVQDVLNDFQGRGTRRHHDDGADDDESYGGGNKRKSALKKGKSGGGRSARVTRFKV